MVYGGGEMKMLPKTIVYRRVLAHYFRTIPVAAAVSILYYIVQGLFPAFTAVILARLFDEAGMILGGKGSQNTLLILGGVYLAAYLLNRFWTFIANMVMDIAADKNQVAYRFEICQKLSKLQLIDFENADIKDKHRRAEEALYSGMLSSIARLTLNIVLVGVVNLVSVSAVLAQYSLWFLPLSVLSVLPYLITRLVRGKAFYRVRFAQAKQQRKLAYLWGLFTDRRSIKELRVSSADDYVAKQWRDIRDETQAEIWNETRKDAVSMVICDVLRIIGYGASVGLALWLTLEGVVSVGVFGACIAAFMSLQNATRSVLEQTGELPNNLSYAGDYFEFIDLSEETRGDGAVYSGLCEKIEVRHLRFKYTNAQEFALRDVSFTLRRGEKLAVLGENGSGKTTLTKLLVGMLPASGGEVLYDGVPVQSLDRASFRKTVSAVAQNFIQYKLTLRENIAMSDTARMSDDAAISEALRGAGLGALLDSVGLDTELGNAFGGSDISGGQWQKLAIARGLFRDSDLIILDEPTSALDPLIETEILSKFVELVKDKTAVIISHRVGLCRLVDKIAVMKEGQLVEMGTHDELIARRGEYMRLYTAQEKWYRPEE